MNGNDLIDVTQIQLIEAHTTLKSEMDGFAGELLKSLASSLKQEKPELLASINNRLAAVYSLSLKPAPKEPWSDYKQDFKQVQATLASKSPGSDATTQQLREEGQLVETVVRLQYEFNEATKKLAPHRLVRLSQEANLLRDLTAMWTVYQEAWQQRYSRHEVQPGIPKIIEAGDKIARGFYDVIEKQKLNVKQDHQSLIVVPFMSELLAGGFDMPTPYIVTPRWGHGQVWTWLAYAHEVGHHIYRNVIGLSHELKVNLAMTLGSQKLNYSIQRLWFNWLEEIFADLFGVLQTGPAFIQTQQHVLLYLPTHVLKHIATNPHPEQGLLQAADTHHPIPYLRARLAIQALEEKLIPNMQDTQFQISAGEQCQRLRDRWESLFADLDDKTKVLADAWRFNKKSVLTETKKKSFEVEKMDTVGEKVLDVILNTKLYALGDEEQPTRTAREVFGAVLLDKEIEKIQAARKAINKTDQGNRSLSDRMLEIILNYQQPQPYEIRHLLVAAQEVLGESSPDASGPAFSVTSPVITTY